MHLRGSASLRIAFRSTPRLGAPAGAKEEAVWNHDQTVRNNTFALNRDAGVWGWFDVRDERHWPKTMQKFAGREKPESQPEADFARDYQSDLDRGAPANLSLEKLNLRFENNLYAPGDSGSVFHWGTAWLRHEYFDGPGALQKVRAQLGLEQGSVVFGCRRNQLLVLSTAPASNLCEMGGLGAR